jgi:hypothetical protein
MLRQDLTNRRHEFSSPLKLFVQEMHTLSPDCRDFYRRIIAQSGGLLRLHAAVGEMGTNTHKLAALWFELDSVETAK